MESGSQLVELMVQPGLPGGSTVLLDVQSELTSPTLPSNATFAFQMRDGRCAGMTAPWTGFGPCQQW